MRPEADATGRPRWWRLRGDRWRRPTCDRRRVRFRDILVRRFGAAFTRRVWLARALTHGDKPLSNDDLLEKVGVIRQPVAGTEAGCCPDCRGSVQ